METINILMFEPSSGFGGSGNSLFNLLSHMDRNRFKPLMVILNDGPQFAKIGNLGIEVIKLKSKERDGFLSDLIFDALPLSLQLIGIIKRKRINLVHINTNIISGISAILAAFFAGVPCISHIRQTRSPICREKIFMSLVKRFVVLNKDVKADYSKYTAEEKIDIVYDGISLKEKIASNNFGKEFDLDGAPCVGMVGRLVDGKGHINFIEAASIIAKIKPKVKFLIVGGDCSKDGLMLGKLRHLADSLNLNGNIIFTGWRNDISDVVSSFDISVQPYTAPEGLPNTVIEAMALKKPVISTDLPGPAEIVIDGKTGFTVPSKNPQALANAVIKLLDNPRLAEEMGEAGRQRVEDLFDIKKNVKQMEAIYERALRTH